MRAQRERNAFAASAEKMSAPAATAASSPAARAPSGTCDHSSRPASIAAVTRSATSRTP
jgi:hypothetical protein